MNKIIISFISFFFLLNSVNAQVIKGTIHLNNKPVQYASVQLYNEKDSLIGTYLSDHHGNFQSKQHIKIIDLVVEVSYIGAKAYKKSFKATALTQPIEIQLQVNDEQIDTVQIFGQKNNTTLALNKRVYKFNKDDFIKHTTADIAINKVPGIVFIEGSGLKLDGYQKAQLYIDGIATNLSQLKNLDFEDIQQVDIINNPSARFNAESNSGIINIITKPQKEAFYKGRLGFTKGILMKRTGVEPSFSLKKGKWLFKTGISFSNYVQETNTEINREPAYNNYYQSNDRKTTTTQGNLNIDLKYAIDTTSSLYLKSEYFGYKLSGFTTGQINNDGFTNDSRDQYWIYTIDGVYDKRFKNDLLSVKSKYNVYRKDDFYRINNEDKSFTNSGLSDISVEMSYSHAFPFFEMTGHDFGVKYIDRSFTFIQAKKFKQYNIGAYSDWSIKLTKKIDFSPSLYLDISNNAVNNENYTLISLLPTANIAFKAGKKSKISLSYKRTINRPSPMDLNEDLIVLDPTTFQRGNKDLKQSSINTINLTYTNPYKKNFLSATLFYSINNRSIFQNVESTQDTLILTKDNIGSIRRAGGTIGHDLSIAKGINLYTSLGLNYNYFAKNNDQNVYNSGIGIMGTLNISARLLKKITTTLLFDYNSRRYDLYSTTEERPFTSLLVSTNVLKDKLNLRLSYVDLFKINSERKIKLFTSKFNQNTVQNRDISNINLSITYIFGKKFSDSISNKAIKYQDIELR